MMLYLLRLQKKLKTFEITSKTIGEYKKKKVNETNSLIDIANVNEGRCTAEYFDHFEDILQEYSFAKAIVAYVSHLKKRLGQLCDRDTRGGSSDD